MPTRTRVASGSPTRTDPTRSGRRGYRSRVSDGATAWRARVVTYGLVALLAFAVWTGTEAWPVTSYRLFSSVRTDKSVSLELVAVAPDGTTRTVRFSGGAVAATSHRYRDLVGATPAEQRRLVDAWLSLSGIDRGEVKVVRLERVARRLDPDGGPATVTGRRVLVEVAP